MYVCACVCVCVHVSMHVCLNHRYATGDLQWAAATATAATAPNEQCYTDGQCPRDAAGVRRQQRPDHQEIQPITSILRPWKGYC